MNFVSPKKTPIKTSGYLVIQSDDAHAGDWYWYNKLKRYNRKYTQFIGCNPLKMSLEINSRMLDTPDYLTSDRLKKMYDGGAEVINHCQYHISLGQFYLAKDASAGDTSINITARSMNDTGLHNNQKAGYRYKYLITDGVNSEEVTLQSATNPILLATPLTHSYASGTIFKLSANSMRELVEGCHDDLVNIGVTVNGLCFPYPGGSTYDSNPDAVSYIATLYDTARGSYGGTNSLPDVNWHNLSSFAIRPNGEPGKSGIDTILDETVANNYLTFVYGHGETDSVTQGLLDYVIDGAMRRGIRIIGQQEAYLMLGDNRR